MASETNYPTLFLVFVVCYLLYRRLSSSPSSSSAQPSAVNNAQIQHIQSMFPSFSSAELQSALRRYGTTEGVVDAILSGRLKARNPNANYLVQSTSANGNVKTNVSEVRNRHGMDEGETATSRKGTDWKEKLRKDVDEMKPVTDDSFEGRKKKMIQDGKRALLKRIVKGKK